MHTSLVGDNEIHILRKNKKCIIIEHKNIEIDFIAETERDWEKREKVQKRERVTSIQFDKEDKLVSCSFHKPQIQEKWF